MDFMTGLAARAVARVMVTGLFFYSKVRLKYKWTYRKYFPRPFTGLLDSVLHVADGQIYCPRTVSDCVRVRQAFLVLHDRALDVTTRIRDIQEREFSNARFGRLGQFHVYIEDLVPPGTWGSCEDKRFWLDVRYTGHADLVNKWTAKTYAVKYAGRCGERNEKVVFPPYSVHTPAETGFGVSRVLLVVDGGEHGDKKNLLSLCKEYAGLRGDFYEQHDDPLILKRHVSRATATVKILEGGCMKTVNVSCKMGQEESVTS
ncbi:FirrV-1-B55 [Feldmannia irregularis virus a]|uniref:FirrV-1-B55 n=1 Tax=Feldmannia irregularis virus a TaxID=231992 RepID=Q6XLY1_9PHYC|nr:FirrV-1-B55 [Feldmannia irregularis virus a]AAR26930.1 FirrV-1-B55 [Feldmannia irregularis virus a]